MKSLISAIILFVLLVGIIVFNSLYVSKFCADISNIVTKIEESDKPSVLLSELKTKWNQSRRWLDFSIRTGEIERMNDLIEGLIASHSAKNEHEVKKHCSLIKQLLEEFSEHEKISVKSLC